MRMLIDNETNLTITGIKYNFECTVFTITIPHSIYEKITATIF